MFIDKHVFYHLEIFYLLMFFISFYLPYYYILILALYYFLINIFKDTLKLLDLLDRIRQNWKDENQKNESLRDQLLAAEQESG